MSGKAATVSGAAPARPRTLPVTVVLCPATRPLGETRLPTEPPSPRGRPRTPGLREARVPPRCPWGAGCHLRARHACCGALTRPQVRGGRAEADGVATSCPWSPWLGKGQMSPAWGSGMKGATWSPGSRSTRLGSGRFALGPCWQLPLLHCGAPTPSLQARAPSRSPRHPGSHLSPPPPRQAIP